MEKDREGGENDRVGRKRERGGDFGGERGRWEIRDREEGR